MQPRRGRRGGTWTLCHPKVAAHPKVDVHYLWPLHRTEEVEKVLAMNLNLV